MLLPVAVMKVEHAPSVMSELVVARHNAPLIAYPNADTLQIAATEAYCKYIQFSSYPRLDWWNPPVQRSWMLESSHENHVQSQQGNARALLRA